jgi:hypothetical protein
MNFRPLILNRARVRFPVIFACFGLLFFCQAAEPAKNKPAAGKHSSAAAADTLSPAAGRPLDTKARNAGTPAREQRKLIVYYFHTTFRCPSCTMMEHLTKQAVESGFAEQMKSGRVEFNVVNIEAPGNEHFVDDYRLYTKSVVLSDLSNGKEKNWKNLDQVWVLLRDQGKFVDYIQKEVRKQIEG